VNNAAIETGVEAPGLHEVFAQAFAGVAAPVTHGDCVVMTYVETPLGPMVAGARGDGLCLFEFSDPRRLAPQIEMVRRRFECPVVPGESPHLDRLRAELREYFAGTRRQFSVPLIAPGTPFQERVWARLLEIPYGTTISYEELAHAVGAPRGQRAVGHANGTNRLAILIPCHRVVNKSGKLGGYGGLLWRKDALLTLERGGQGSLLNLPGT
jgi:AraC family transcriptional regulator of adaptative response/methylated-DNA-[protein]-cysteine methyltransferase